MKQVLLSTIGTIILLGKALAWDNSPPIPERYVSWTEGKGKSMIEFEFFFDVMCSDCADFHPDFDDFLAMPFLNGTVLDAIKVRYSFSPLPYHHGVWVAHKLLPYIIDSCLSNAQGCKLKYYVKWALQNQNTLLSAKDSTFDELAQLWTSMVSQAFGWPQSDLLAVYGSDTDKHKSERRTRDMWEYAVTQGIYNTPGLMVNGIAVNDMQPKPLNSTQLMQILQDTYNS